MADYTVTVLDLIQNDFDFGLEKYPIFDENYRPILNEIIIEYYKFKEIGFQNPAVWRDRLNQRMSLIMIKYNKLFNARLTEFDPLHNINIEESFQGANDSTINENTNGETTNVIDTDNNSSGFASRYPSEKMIEGDLTNDLYITAGERGKNSGTTIDDTNVKNTIESNNKMNQNYNKTTKGSSSGNSFSKSMLDFRNYVEKYDIEIQIIDELSDLFMQRWGMERGI